MGLPWMDARVRIPCSECGQLVTEGGPMTIHQRGHDPNQIERTRRRSETAFWTRVDKSGPGGCWLWTGHIGRKGYGFFTLVDQTRRAHTLAYEALVGPVPPGLELDHLCRNRACVNPAHLEPVTHLENVRRGRLARAVIA